MIAKMTDTAQTVLEKRYFINAEDCWEDLTLRVSGFFGKTKEERKMFRKTLESADFLLNSPALMNAGTSIESFSACYVLPVEDSIESIFKYYSDAALISKSGGGIGATFTHIRPKNSDVSTTSGVASGPISFMEGQDALTEVIKQGGRRRGANMGILMCDHPDVWNFVKAKDTPGVLENFNLSVGITDHFMELAMSTNDSGGTIEQELWWELTERAWSSGEPGVLFMDTIEKGNLAPTLGKLESTNPCGEQPLLPYESCTLGSINLSNFVCHITKGVDWTQLKSTVKTAVLLLNRVLDCSVMPIPECQKAMEDTRKIGLGIMGLHDMLIQLKLPYDTQGGRDIAARVMEFIAYHARKESASLGIAEGHYDAWDSLTDMPARRNLNLTTIAPTGTLSLIANCSSGCEPYYEPMHTRENLGKKFTMVNKWFEKDLRKFCTSHGLDYEVVLRDKAKWPQWIVELYKGAGDIHWKDHIKMQGVLQEYVDSSISKTINMPNEATVEEVREAYELAYKLGCKGVTAYRDGSRESQVLSSGTEGVGEPSDTGLPDSSVEEKPSESGRDTKSLQVDSHGIPVPYKMDLPERLNAVRHRLTDHSNNKVYFTVCTYDSQPVEVFARMSEEIADSYWHTMARLLSLMMRYNIPLVDITKQLRKGSHSVADTPAKLARILSEYTEDTDSRVKVVDTISSHTPCPECGKGLTPESGCVCCKYCGYSQCS